MKKKNGRKNDENKDFQEGEEEYGMKKAKKKREDIKKTRKSEHRNTTKEPHSRTTRQ